MAVPWKQKLAQTMDAIELAKGLARAMAEAMPKGGWSFKVRAHGVHMESYIGLEGRLELKYEVCSGEELKEMFYFLAQLTEKTQCPVDVSHSRDTDHQWSFIAKPGDTQRFIESRFGTIYHW